MASTSRARATSGAHGFRTRSRCGSSAATSPSVCVRARHRCPTAAAGSQWCAYSKACSSRSTEAHVLRPSDRAPGLMLDDDVVLPHDIEIGVNAVIHAGVQLGSGVRIQDAAILGKALVLSRQSQAELREPDPTVIGDE